MIRIEDPARQLKISVEPDHTILMQEGEYTTRLRPHPGTRIIIHGTDIDGNPVSEEVEAPEAPDPDGWDALAELVQAAAGLDEDAPPVTLGEAGAMASRRPLPQFQTITGISIQEPRRVSFDRVRIGPIGHEP